jgi:hypothetical protein
MRGVEAEAALSVIAAAHDASASEEVDKLEAEDEEAEEAYATV